MSNLRRDIDRLTNEQKGDALEYYLSDNRINRATKVLEKTIDDIILHLEENNIVEKLHDKDDKSFDRGKILLKDLLDLVKDLEETKMSALNVEKTKSFTKQSSSNGILAMIREQREQNK